MARPVAFAMLLPALWEEQEKMVRRYGKEHCQELRIIKRDDGVNVVAGILITPFKTKKVAQTAFGSINLKSWGVARPKYSRDWYRELSLDEYFNEFGEEERVLGRRMQTCVTSSVMFALRRGLARSSIRADVTIAKDKVAKEKREKISKALVDVDTRRVKEIFEVFAASVRNRHREQGAMMRADGQGRRVALFEAKEAKRQAELAYIERLKCPVFKAQVDKERVDQEKEGTPSCKCGIPRRGEEEEEGRAVMRHDWGGMQDELSSYLESLYTSLILGISG